MGTHHSALQVGGLTSSRTPRQELGNREVATAAVGAIDELLPGGYEHELRRGFASFIRKDFGAGPRACRPPGARAYLQYTQRTGAAALEAFNRCMAARPEGADAANVLYNTAACHSLQGQAPAAQRCLWAAFERGLSVTALLEDPDFKRYLSTASHSRI